MVKQLALKRKKFMMGNKPLARKLPKGTPIGEGTLKVKIFKGKGGKNVIHLPKGTEIKMTKGKYMVSKRGLKKALKSDRV